MSRYALLHGDVLEHLRTLPSNSMHGVLSDPPYGISFMGKAWDYDVPSVDVWREVLRVLRPGAPLLSFGGSRTWHRIAVAIEDAGFEIRDSLMWMYGSGFPKSLSIDKALDKAAGATREVVGSRTLTGSAALTTAEKGGTFASGTSSAGRSVEVAITAPATDLAKLWSGYGTALKPSYEPVILARKPLDGTVAENVARWGVGGLAIDATRIGVGGGGTNCTNRDAAGKCLGHKNAGRSTSGETFHGPETVVAVGRWPANVLLDEEAGAILDAQSGNRPGMSGGGKHKADYPGGMFGGIDSEGTARGDSGGASRFFYCPKTSRRERELGCESLPTHTAGEMTDREDETDGLNSPRAGAGRTSGAKNDHPCCKPIALVEYLAKLILPPSPGAVLLVPFSGSGSEIAGALRAGWPAVVGIEREAEYITIAGARIPAHVPGSRRVA